MNKNSEKNVSELKQECEKIYNEQIYSLLLPFEVLRKKILTRNFIFKCIIVLAYLLLFGITYFYAKTIGAELTGFAIGCFIALLCVCIILPIFINNGEDFFYELKKTCLPVVLKNFNNIKWYTDKKLISEKEIARSGLFPCFSEMSVDDEFEGKYRNLKFKISEISLKTKIELFSIKIFEGILIVIDSNKKVKNRTMIAPKGTATRKNVIIFAIIFVLIGSLFNTDLWGYIITGDFKAYIIMLIALIIIAVFSVNDSLKKEEKLDCVMLEDSDFIQNYKIYSSDQVEARYLLTPIFIDRFKKFKSAFNCKYIKCSFYDDKIMFAISSKESAFEMGSLNHEINTMDSYKLVFEELCAIHDLIEYFKFDEKTGL